MGIKVGSLYCLASGDFPRGAGVQVGCEYRIPLKVEALPCAPADDNAADAALDQRLHAAGLEVVTRESLPRREYETIAVFGVTILMEIQRLAAGLAREPHYPVTGRDVNPFQRRLGSSVLLLGNGRPRRIGHGPLGSGKSLHVAPGRLRQTCSNKKYGHCQAACNVIHFKCSSGQLASPLAGSSGSVLRAQDPSTKLASQSRR